MPKEILIVDDEPSIIVPIQYLMEQQDYNVLVAENGEYALDIIFKYKLDLILLDIMLPGIDGYEVCEIVRLNPDFRDVKTIFKGFRPDCIQILFAYGKVLWLIWTMRAG